MSYLDFPRFTFTGNFYTDPSTMDNDPSHYDDSCTNPSPWQDPGGSHFFSFQDILASQIPNRPFTQPVVTSAVDVNGNVSLADSLVGVAVSSVDSPGGVVGGPFSPAKMVDLDVYQQAVSQIFGFFLKLQVGNISLIGSMDPCSLNSARFDRVLPTRGWAPWDGYGAASYGGDTNASGVFQSILRVPAASWPAASGSPILDQIRTAASQDSAGNLLLSFRMTLDGYQNVAYHSADFRIGRIVASVGPFRANDASQVIAGRWLAGRSHQNGDVWNQPSLYGAPFQVKAGPGGTFVSLDLSNALMTVSPGAAPLDLANVSVYIGDGSTGVVGAPFQMNSVLYNLGGGIVDLALSAAQITAAASSPFFVVSSRTDIAGFSKFNGLPVMWQESASGTWVACSDRNFQLASDTPSLASAAASIYVTQWGAPVSNASAVQTGVYPCFPNNGAATVPWVAGYKGNSPSSDGCLTATLTLAAPGRFQLTLAAVRDPGSRTPELDSQLYFVCVTPASQPPPPPNLNPSSPPQEQIVSCVVWAAYTVNTTPEWPEIHQIMKVFDKLFPAMHAKMDLCNQQTVFTFSANPPWAPFFSGTPGPMQITLPNGGTIAAGAIAYYMSREGNDPRFMPITRSLSPNKALTYLYYCYNIQQKLIPTPPPPSSTSPAGVLS